MRIGRCCTQTEIFGCKGIDHMSISCPSNIRLTEILTLRAFEHIFAHVAPCCCELLLPEDRRSTLIHHAIAPSSNIGNTPSPEKILSPRTDLHQDSKGERSIRCFRVQALALGFTRLSAMQIPLGSARQQRRMSQMVVRLAISGVTRLCSSLAFVRVAGVGCFERTEGI